VVRPYDSRNTGTALPFLRWRLRPTPTVPSVSWSRPVWLSEEDCRAGPGGGARFGTIEWHAPPVCLQNMSLFETTPLHDAPFRERRRGATSVHITGKSHVPGCDVELGSAVRRQLHNALGSALTVGFRVSPNELCRNSPSEVISRY
jgi:hypothetical protein